MKAFPSEYWEESVSEKGTATLLAKEKGMDLRDYFAAKAIPIAYKHYKEWLQIDCDEYLSWNESNKGEVNLEIISEKCYQLADAMMKAREQ